MYSVTNNTCFCEDMKKTLTSHQHRNQGKLIYLDYRIEHIFGHTSNVYELVITALIQLWWTWTHVRYSYYIVLLCLPSSLVV